MAKIKVNIAGDAFTGKIVTFMAPCDCTEATGLLIGDDIYDVVDAFGEIITGGYRAWRAGAQVSVSLNSEDKKAYVQNAGTYAVQIGGAAPTNSCTLWLNTEASGQANVAMLSLDEGAGSAVHIDVGGEAYSVSNASFNSEPTKKSYDFTVF